MNTDGLVGAAKLAVWLRNRIERRVPTSVIRVGDGEGTFLPYDDEIKLHQARDRKFIQNIWWRPEDIISDDDAETLSRQFQNALQNADGIGLPSIERVARTLSFVKELNTQLIRGLRTACARFQEIPRESCCDLVFSCNAHQDLLNWNLYGEILAPLSEINCVSCHDLAPAMLERFGLKTKWAFRTPPESRHAEAMSAEDQGIRPIYPNGLDAFVRTAPVERGDVYLIAAGFVGKLMCDHVKRRGGIAIDIGSVADRWMGYNTRRSLDWELDFSLSASRILHQPFAKPAAIETSATEA
jgi:hypothetical protein